MNSFFEFFTKFDFTSRMGILLYWVPVFLCAYDYLIETAKDYRADLRERREFESGEKTGYYPSLTYWNLVNRFLATITPIVNIWVSITQTFPNFLDRIGKYLSKPLVPKRKKD